MCFRFRVEVTVVWCNGKSSCSVYRPLYTVGLLVFAVVYEHAICLQLFVLIVHCVFPSAVEANKRVSSNHYDRMQITLIIKRYGCL